jgi:hypothetical protein
MVGVEPSREELLDASLRPFTNHTFYFAIFDEDRFQDDHYHCIACWRTITALDRPNVEHEGYVTVHDVHYTGFPVLLQYAWSCKECFQRYRDAYGWKLSPETISEISPEANRAFDSAYQEYLAGRKQNPDRESPG